MDPPARPRRMQATPPSPVGLGPDDSISQISSQSVSTGFTEEVYDLESSPIQTGSNSSQRTRGTSNTWLWEQFEITTLSQQWRPKRSKKLRMITSTTNMSYHLQKSHGLPLGNDRADAAQPTIMTIIVREESHSLGRGDKTTVYCH
ncbi:hypothetical protein V1507DRAFT_479741 [Lipomyces tetrasporus]